MIHDHRSAITLTLLFVLPACSGVDDPFSGGGGGSGDPDAGEPAAYGGSGATRDGGAKGGRSGHQGGTSGTSGTSGTGTGEGGDGSDGDDDDGDDDDGDDDDGGDGDDDDGDDDPDAGTGGMGDPSGGASSTGGSCSRGGSGGCGHSRGGMSGSGGGGGMGCDGAGACGHAGSGMSGSGGAGSGGCHHGGAGAGGMPGGAAGMSGAGGTAGTSGAGGVPALDVLADIFPFACDHVHPYEVHRVLDASGAPVENYTCEWTFDGGGTSDLCGGDHEFPSAGRFGGTVIVRDTATGATGTVTTPKIPVVDPISMTITAEAPECGLTISYVTTITGGRGRGFTGITVTPLENVLTPGPLPPSGTVEVSAPGTYRVHAAREEETTGPICGASAMTDVVVNACP